MASKSEMNVINKHSKDCPVVQVTVYKDRAQVSRTVQVEVTEGIQELHITDFVEIEEDSIRVEGKGNATIAEVSFQTEKNAEDGDYYDDALYPEEREVKEEIRRRMQETKSFSSANKKEIIENEKKLLDAFFDRAAKTGIAPGNQESSNVELAGSFLQGVKEYLTEYRTLRHAMLSDLHEIDVDEKKKLDAIVQLEIKLGELRKGRPPTQHKRQCIIVLDSPKKSKIELTVSYIVFSASWVPSYDLRMFTDTGNLKLFYYGLISQFSGEDWDDAKIFLSTAEPSCGGNIPSIPITHLSSAKPPSPVVRRKMHSMPMRAACAPMHHPMSLHDEPTMDVAEVKVVDKTTSTSYEIARNSSIPSDNQPHKVTVAILDYGTELSYVTVPKASPNAFLRAKVVNTSPFMLLAGKSSIFVDNSFICKTLLQSVAPKEEFTCSLGVDPSVRVTYKPVIKMKSVTGLVSKSESNVYEQIIEVKNLHDKTVNILVQDSLPKSLWDKIKVNLISPVIDSKHPEKTADVRLTKFNAVEWDLCITSMSTKEVLLKYSIDHPADATIETTIESIPESN